MNPRTKEKMISTKAINSYSMVGIVLDIEILRTYCLSHLLSEIRESRGSDGTGVVSATQAEPPKAALWEGGMAQSQFSSDMQLGSFGN